MVPTCVNKGGLASLVRLNSVPKLDEEVRLAAEAFAALACWQPKLGESVTLLDPEDTAYRAKIVALDSALCTCLPFQRLSGPIESLVAIEIYQAPPRLESFEPVLRTLTELGVTRIAAMQTLHSAPQAELNTQELSHRWSDAVTCAAKQNQRAVLPELFAGLTFEEALLNAASAELKLLLSNSEASWSLVEGFGSLIPQSVAILVGPEDGFTEEEVARAQELGFLPVSLGPRMLKTETAAIVAAALVQGHLGDLR